jgi:competence protein ComEC
METHLPEQRRNPIARRPALLVAAMFMLGISLHRVAPHRPALWLIVAAGATLIAGLLLRKPRLASLLISISIISVALSGAQLFAFQYRSDEISLFAGDDPRLAEIEMEIVTPPRILTDPYNTNRALPPKQVATARALRIKTHSGWADASGELLVQIAQPHPRLAYPQRIRVLGMLQRPAPAMNPGQFDWAGYYRDQRILTSLQIQHARNIEILEPGTRNPIAWLREHARRLLAAGFRSDRSLDHALLRALLLGDSDPQLRDVQEQFQRTGTSHHLAISGMHVAVLGAFVFVICRMLCLSPRKTAVIATAFVVLYGIVALPSPPVVRSILLCLAVGVGMTSRRAIDYLQLLAVSVILMLCYRPLDLYNAGFQLSFGTVMGMILLTPAVERTMKGWREDRDVRIADALTPATPWKKIADKADSLFVKSLAAGFVAWLVSMPLIAWHFEQLNPWAVPASLALGLIVFVALVLGFLKIAMTLFFPSLAAFWVTLFVWPITWMRLTVDWLARWPRSDVPLPPPPWWIIALYYGCLLTMLIPFKRQSMVWMMRITRVGMLLVLLWLPYEADVARRRPEGGSVRVTLLAVGAGQCAIVEPPSGRVVLIDAGSSSLSDLTAKCLGPCLRHLGCTNIDSIYLSHPDYDHISATAEVAGSYGVREVLTGSHFREHAAGNFPAEAMLRALDGLQRPPRVLLPGQKIPLGAETTLEVLWPPEQMEHVPSNESCLVLKITHAGRAILLPGDIEDIAMRALLQEPESLQADVLVAAHHGSSESLTRDFIAAVNPKAIVSSNDRTLSRKQIDFEDMIDARPLFRTHTSGAITIEISRAGQVKVWPFLQNGREPVVLPTSPARSEPPPRE